MPVVSSKYLWGKKLRRVSLYKCQAQSHSCRVDRCLALHLGARDSLPSMISKAWLSSRLEYLYWKSYANNSERCTYSLDWIFPQMEVGTCARGRLVAGDSC